MCVYIKTFYNIINLSRFQNNTKCKSIHLYYNSSAFYFSKINNNKVKMF